MNKIKVKCHVPLELELDADDPTWALYLEYFDSVKAADLVKDEDIIDLNEAVKQSEDFVNTLQGILSRLNPQAQKLIGCSIKIQKIELEEVIFPDE